MNVFNVCHDFGVVCGVVCFLRLGVVYCGIVGGWGVVIFGLSVMRVVGGVPLWVVCVFRRSCRCLCLLCTQLLF